MAVWPGLGVNYKAAQVNWDADIAYFNSIGLKNIRPHMPGSPQPWNSTTNALWRTCAQHFHDAGFWVTWGTSQSPITASNWQALHDSIVAEAQYLQQQGIVVDEYEIGNEYEGGIHISLNSLTQTGGLATATASKAHGFQTGESVTIYGASPSGYNGTFTITKTGSTTFTFPVSSGLSSPATGSISCYSMSITQLNANLRQLAADVKAVYTLGQVSYACYNNNVNGTSTYTDWITNGLGALDTLSIHPYGNINLANQTITDGGYTYVEQMMQAFGEKCYVSEFNLDAGSANLDGFNTGASVEAMEHFYKDYLLKYLKPYNSKAMVYMWSGYQNQDDEFAMQLTSGSLIQPWGVLIGNGNPTTRSDAGGRGLQPKRRTAVKARSSLFFGGANADSYVTPADGTILQLGASGDYTVGGRVKLYPKTESPNNDNHTIANCDLNYGSNLGYEFQVTGNTGALNAYSGSTGYTSSTGLVQYGTWQSVIFRLSGTTLDGFVQGQKVWTTTITRKAAGSSGRFGTENTGTGATKRRVYGNAREFFAVKSALSDAQIQGIALDAVYPTVGVLYKLDESGGSGAGDGSGNSNNATITGAVWSTDSDSLVRTNIVTDPSLEQTEASSSWGHGNAGTLTGLAFAFRDTTHVLYGSYALMLQANANGQYYLNRPLAFTPSVGVAYTFSAYVYVPTGSLISRVGIGIRDFSTYNYVTRPDGGTGEVYFTVTPGQWTRLWYTAVGGALASGSAAPTWRFTVADPQDSGHGTSSFTTPQTYWVDGTLVETSSTLGNYFDGDNGGSWSGTANASASTVATGRYDSGSRDAVT